MHFLAQKYYQDAIYGRYITNRHIMPLLQRLSSKCTTEILGFSVNKEEIYGVRAGTGAKKIILWSQMHGNESTTTKALIDFLFFLDGDETTAKFFLDTFSFVVIPILNPDGARNYTRENANGVDLNRDAFAVTQPESALLHQVCMEESPFFTFNLHDQRTIFGAGNEKYPATLSFLAPAFDEERTLNKLRERVMQVAAALQKALQDDIPKQVGRFSDAFNINCIGDYLTAANIPVILVEAGHYPNDYQREETRKLVFAALFRAVECLADDSYLAFTATDYAAIPENKKTFCDVLIKGKEGDSLALQYKEYLVDNTVKFELQETNADITSGAFGHVELELPIRGVLTADGIIEKLECFGCNLQSNGLIDVNNLLKK